MTFLHTLYETLQKHPIVLGLLLTVCAFFTYFWNYTNPPYLYWDENYHIASAQKYLNEVYFMEPHPPLGKLLIAAGEKLFDANTGSDDEFIGTDYARQLPTGFSFKGYRFFPVLLGWLTAPLFYLIFLLITRKPIWAFLLSFLYVFDNALITHSRAAMLDSTMLFFAVAQIASLYLLLEHQRHRHKFPLYCLLFGVSFGCLMATKALGLILVLLFPIGILALRKHHSKTSEYVDVLHCASPFFTHLSQFDWRKIGQFLALSLGGSLITYLAIWQIHFSLGNTVIHSLPDNGFYKASESYQLLLSEGKTHLPLMLQENLAFLSHYSEGVPELNLCKADENGSPFFFWPFGARSINYRWETPDNVHYEYITLQVNPIVWGTVLLGVLLGTILLLGSFLLPDVKPLRYRNALLIWLGMWASYMIAISQIDRVMYLYHYFLPLLFSFILFAYVLKELTQIGKWQLDDKIKQWLLLGCATCIFVGFHFYRPLTYYEPLTDAEFQRRNIFSLWDLRCVNCVRKNSFATPIAE